MSQAHLASILFLSLAYSAYASATLPAILVATMKEDSITQDKLLPWRQSIFGLGLLSRR